MSGKGRGLAIAAVVVGLVGLSLGLGGVAYARQAFGGSVVSSESMTPTYGPGDRVVFERVDGSEVRRGDVVVFSAPDRYGFEGLVMERVIGVGGDHVVCCTGEGADTRVTVNGKPLQEPYVKNAEASRGFGMASYDVRVPEGRLFMLGDHRANARDSRAFLDDRGGTLPKSVIRGRVVEDYTVPAVLGTAMMLGVVLTLVGVGLGIAAVVVRRKARALVPPPPPWAARV
ncbi:signal peptidase I [Streptomyces viridochromogenes]|uniref:Signal peptidase I n=1 Tax=Streptomyces viridochromogenes Tue57 TaxID=1160705 RepID=L8P845_STRVR|nr:signal peptidase I [Streptomyces viridochromogenes]ELS53756.1 putative signal peptidase I [Streptomyces viridochromogenes Tue57]